MLSKVLISHDLVLAVLVTLVNYSLIFVSVFLSPAAGWATMNENLNGL